MQKRRDFSADENDEIPDGDFYALIDTVCSLSTIIHAMPKLANALERSKKKQISSH